MMRRATSACRASDALTSGIRALPLRSRWLELGLVSLLSLAGCKSSGVGVPGMPGTSPAGQPSGTALPSAQLPSGQVSPPSLEWPESGASESKSERAQSPKGEEQGSQQAQLPADSLPPAGSKASDGSKTPTGASGSGSPGAGSSESAETARGSDGSDASASGEQGTSAPSANAGDGPLDPSSVDWTRGYEGLERSAGAGGGGAMTSAERVAAAERALEASMADYDGELQKEARDAPQAPADGGTNTGVGTSATSGSSAASKGAADRRSGRQGSGQPGSGQPGSTRSADADPTSEGTGSEQGASGAGSDSDHSSVKGASRRGAQGASPDRRAGDNPDAVQDDDVVARQLREAAEAEKDPELREKLWEEYRRYKEGL